MTALGTVLSTTAIVLRTDLEVSRTKYSGGAVLIGLPIVEGITAVSTMANIANSARYTPLIVMASVTLDQVIFEVTTGPASNANFRAGLYAADTDWQPTGAPLFDSATAVASGFTGVKTATISTAVPAGRYLSIYNMDVAMTLRKYGAGMRSLETGLGASPGSVQYVVAQTYGAFPNPGTLHTGGGGATNTTINHIVLWRWTVP